MWHFLVRSTFVALVLGIGFETAASAAEPKASDRVVLTRLFFQDDEARTLRWADVYAGSPPTLGSVQTVAGFPTLDAETQSLVQMGSAREHLLVGVRDDDDGKKHSGWILVDSGVGSEDHGDHSHSTYAQPPRIRAARIDAQQGNPAHLYVYDEVFYLANDKLSGYTRLDPAQLKPRDDVRTIVAKSQFITGGGGHITLAVLNKAIGYSTWIDREGDNTGRVDVTPFRTRQIAYSLKLPTGGLHGATANSGKVFFAPADGICWVTGDSQGISSAATTPIQHLSLGHDPDSDRPVRAGAFVNFGKHVLCVTGIGSQAALQMLDATEAAPKLHRVALNMAAGARPVGPIAGVATGRWSTALIFHDQAAATPGPADKEEHVSLVELDPNGDGSLTDARIGKVLKVGRSRVSGHAGHHDAVFLGDNRHVVFSNPGDGTLGLLRIRRQEIIAEFKVGGVPTKVEAIGGPSGD